MLRNFRYWRALGLVNINKICENRSVFNSVCMKRSQGHVVLQNNIKFFHTSSMVRKYNKKSSHDEDLSDDEDEDVEFKDERDSKVVKTKVNSLRTDLLLKAGIGMARNKVETHFYESKIRVNGQKIPKKSTQLNIGDEIDVVRGFSQSNPAHLVVSRIVILAANDREDGTIAVHLRRYKSLLVENYSGANVYKSSDTVEQ